MSCYDEFYYLAKLYIIATWALKNSHTPGNLSRIFASKLALSFFFWFSKTEKITNYV